LEKYIDIKLHGFTTKSRAKWGDLSVKVHLKIVEHEF